MIGFSDLETKQRQRSSINFCLVWLLMALNSIEMDFYQIWHYENVQFKRFFAKSNVYDVPAAFEANHFTQTNLAAIQLAGYNGYDDDDSLVDGNQTRFYVRPAVRNLWQFLDTVSGNPNKGPSLSVVGPTGSGKSIAVERYAFLRDSPTNRFLYVRSVGGVIYFIWYRLATQQYELATIKAEEAQTPLFVNSLIESAVLPAAQRFLEAQTVIIDGFTPEIHKQFHAYMASPDLLPLKFIRCLSWHSQPVQRNVENARRMNPYKFPGWSHADYHNAIRLHCFPMIARPNIPAVQVPQVINAIVLERIYYCGGNARLFSSAGAKWADYVMEVLDDALECSSSVSEGALQAMQHSPNVVSTLFSFDEAGATTFVSEYAAKIITRTHNQMLIRFARQKMANNPAFQGLITKMNVLDILQSSNALPLHDVVHPYPLAETWQKSFCIWFKAANEIRRDRQLRMYYLPKKWNQGAFDGIFLLTPHSAFFFNVADASKHSLKPTRLHPFIRALNIHNVYFYFIGRKEYIRQFAAPRLTGEQRIAMNALLMNIFQAKNNVPADEPPRFTIVLRSFD